MKKKKPKRIPINEKKNKKKQKCQKQQSNDKTFKTNHQCPKCGDRFSSLNGIYNIHLNQCQIVQQSLAMDIHQEESSSSYYNPLNEMTTNTRSKLIKQQQTALYDNSYKLTDFGCFTERLSRIDLKRTNFRIKEKTFSDNMNTGTCTQTLPAHHQVETDDFNDNHASNDENVNSKYNGMHQESIYQTYEKAWTLFEKVASKAYNAKARVSVECIPFPSKVWEHNGDDLCSFGLSPEMSLNLKRTRIRQLLMRWHPDKFLQLYGYIICEHDLPVIVARANDIVRSLTKLKAALS